MDTDSFILYIKTFTQTLQKMSKLVLILKNMNETDHYVKKKTK